MLLLVFLFTNLLDFEGAELNEKSDDDHEEESYDVGPVPRINVRKESLLSHLGHGDLVVVVAGIAGSASDESVGAENGSCDDQGLVVDDDGDDSSGDRESDNGHPEEPRLLGTVQDGFIEDKTGAETTPSSKKCSTISGSPGGKQTSKDTDKGATAEEVPEISKI